MTIVHDEIAAGLAALVAQVPAPTVLLYGSDLSCVEDLADDLTMTDPASPAGIVEECQRRLITPRGSVPGAPDFGTDMYGILNAPMHTYTRTQLVSMATAELLKSEFIESVEAAITGSTPANYKLTARFTPKDPTVNTFDHVFAFDAKKVQETP